MSSMNGHIIVNTLIAVDIWKRDTDKYVHFLSHCHTDHTVGLSSTWRLPIYTTHFNAWMLKNKFRVKSDLLQCLSVGDNHIISVPETGEEFTVTLIDANHCPGSVMFLFQGSFGTILYTGDFRYDPVMLENKVLEYVMKNELLDDLYIDNTYASPHCKIPSRKEAAQQAVQIIREHPEHKILLGLKNLGKEELLSEIALEFYEKICVSEDRLMILQKLQYEDVFTTDPESCRIHVVNFYAVTPSYMQRRQKEHPHIAILPTALYTCGFDDGNLPYKNSADRGIYMVPYSDHSPYEELFTFISHLKPTKIYPIVNETKPRSKVLHRGFIKTLSTLTDSLYELCREKRWESTNCQNKELSMSCDTKEHKVLPAHLCCDIKHTKSRHRPRTRQRQKLSKVFQKKGVQFESSFTSDEGDDKTLQTDGKHTTELERKDVTLRTSCGKFTTVKIPHNLKDNWSEVQVKLFDIRYFVHGRERPSGNRGGASSYTMPSHSSGGRINPCKDVDTASEEFGSCSAYSSDGSPLQDMSLSCAVHMKHTINTQGNPSDIDQISFNSLSDVTKPHTKSLGDTVGSEQEFEDRVWSGLISVKEERTQEHDINPDSENGNLSRQRTEDTVKNSMVMIPTDVYTDQRLLESSELNNATEETQTHCQWMCPISFHKRGCNKPTRCSRDSGIIVSTNAGLLDLNRMYTRKKRCTKQNIHSLPCPRLLCDINATQNTSCESNLHKACDDRIHITSVKSLQTSDWSSEPDMQQSDTESLLQVSSAPTLLTCSDAQSHKASDDRIQITSVKSLQTSDWSSEPDMQQSDTGSLLQVSSAPTLLTCSDAQSHKASDDRIQITPVKSLQTSDWSSEPDMQQSNTGSLLQVSFAPTLLTCSDAQSHKASDDRIQITPVKSLQTSDWSSEPEMQQSDTGCLLQVSSAPTLLTCSDAQCPDKGNLAVTGCRKNSKKRKHIALVTEENRVTSWLKTRDRITSNKETRITSEISSSHFFEEPERNSSVSQNKQSLNQQPHSSDMLQTDGQHKAGVQCEEMLLTQNAARITPSFQQMEVVTAESGGIRSSQSDENEEGNVAKRKQISSEYNHELEKVSNLSFLGHKKDCECSSSETSVLVTDSTNVGESYSLRKRCNHNSDGRKDKATVRSDSMLRSNNSNIRVQSMDQNVAVVIADKSSEHGKHIEGVRNTPHNSQESNRTPADECEALVCPGMPMSDYQDRNYWTNGNRVPFAICEVQQAVKHLRF